MDWRKLLCLELGLLLFMASSVLAANDEREQFLGGTMSYIVYQKQEGTYMVDISLLTGWVLGKGPCGSHCTNADIGRSTIQSRQEMIQKHDLSWFGSFFEETIDPINKTTKYLDITTKVLSNFTENVVALSESARWEQEIFKFTFEVPNGMESFDINYDGHSWKRLPLQGGDDVYWHLQVKINTKIRSDTNRVNRSPRAFDKSFYRVKLGEKQLIRVYAIDDDDDHLKCHMAAFQEGGLIANALPPNVSVISEIEGCFIEIDSSPAAGYTDGTWIGVPVMITDYNTEVITYGTDIYLPYQFSISQTSVQLSINIVENLDTPVFVSPTLEENHKIILYANSRWESIVYVQSPVNRSLEEIVVFGRDEEVFELSVMQNYPDRIHNVTVSWKPVSTDVGQHLCCIRAADNTGIDTDRCFKLDVRPNVYSHSYVENSGRPYFIDIPAPDQFVGCSVNATCVLPLYVRSLNDLQLIDITKDCNCTAVIGPIEKEIRDGNVVYISMLSFKYRSPGRETICLQASDANRVKSEEVCINAEISSLDPCLSSPCRNSAECKSDRLTGEFTCSCHEGFHGIFCEIKNDPCEPQPGPCDPENTVNCYYINRILSCYCKPYATGQYCETMKSCDGDKCKHDGKCVTNLTSKTANCLCKICFEGTFCDRAVNNTSGLPGLSHFQNDVTEANQYFDVASCIPQDIECDSVSPCCISLPYHGSKDLPPIIGFKSEEITNVSTYVVSQTSVHGDTYVAVTCVTGRPGQHRMCQQTTTNGTEQRVNLDEICFNISIKNEDRKNTTKDDVFENLPPGTTVVCRPFDVCHLPVITDKKAGSCGAVTECGENMGGVNIFPPTITEDKCVTDIAIKTGASYTNKTLCISAGTEGGTREISIVTENKSGFGPCQKLHCWNGGSCIARTQESAECRCTEEFKGTTCQTEKPACENIICHHDGFCDGRNRSNPICYCRRGFTGNRCEHAEGSVLVHNYTKAQSFFSDMVVPAIINCICGHPCEIYLQIRTPGELPNLSLGYVDPRIVIEETHINRTSVNTIFSAISTVLTSSAGRFKSCFQLNIDSSIVDELCLSVDVKNASSNISFIGKPMYLHPTLSNESKVICLVNQICHFDMHFSKGPTVDTEEQCPYLTEASNTNLTGYHIFKSENNTFDCTSDVSYLSKEAVVKKICLQVEVPGMKGETRCYKIMVKSDLTNLISPCVGHVCKNGGKCVARISLNLGECICVHGYIGADCDKPANRSSDLPGVSGIREGNMQHFDSESGVPLNITCDSVNPCCISKPYHGSKEYPPINGFTSPTISNISTVVISPVTNNPSFHIALTCVMGTPGQHRVCKQTTTNGTQQGINVDEICYTIEIKSEGKQNTSAIPGFKNIPAGSTVVCQPNTVCHIPMISDKKSGHCEQVRECGVGLAGVNVFPTTESGDLCVTDIAVKTGEDDRTDQLCLASMFGGEHKEIIVSTQNITGFGPCQKIHCLNGGSCIATTNICAKCKCPAGFNGTTCEEATRPVLDDVEVSTQSSTTESKNSSVTTESTVKPDLIGASSTELFNRISSSTRNSDEITNGLETSKFEATTSLKITKTTSRVSDGCNMAKAAEHARKMVISGHASCSCLVNGTKIHIIKKKPVVQKETMAKTAAFGAGGMTGLMGVGGVIYVLVNKFRQPSNALKKRVSPPTPRGRVHPEAAKVVNPLHQQNVLSF